MDEIARNVTLKPIEWLKPYSKNARTHSPEQVAQIVASINEWGWTNPILTDEEGLIIAGHGRLMAAQKLGLSQVPVIIMAGWTEDQKRAYVLADNQLALNAGWDLETLRSELTDLDGFAFDLAGLGFDLGKTSKAQTGAGSLAEKFGIPPFSVLNAREGWWQDRKRAWLALGIQSELGRGGGG